MATEPSSLVRQVGARHGWQRRGRGHALQARRIGALVVLTVLMTPLLAACSNKSKEVLLVGDSITLSSAGELVAIGNNVASTDPINRITFSIVANQFVGARRTVGPPEDPDEYWRGLLTSAIEVPGAYDAVVVALGTNDCRFLADAGDYAPDIERIVGSITEVDPDVPIFWLQPKEHPDHPDCAELIRDDLASAVDAHPTLETWDYGSWADSRPECYVDGIHPRERWHDDPRSGGTAGPPPSGYCAGQFEYAQWLKAHLDTHFGPPE
jgi:hypothetical protein